MNAGARDRESEPFVFPASSEKLLVMIERSSASCHKVHGQGRDTAHVPESRSMEDMTFMQRKAHYQAEHQSC